MPRIPAGISINSIDVTAPPPPPPALVPNAPATLTVTANSVTNTAIGLTWATATVPTGGPAVTGYWLYQNGVHVKSVAVVNSTTMTNLATATSYDFQVSAININGEGPKSPTRTQATTGTGGLPGAPGTLHTTATASDSAIFLAWTAATPDSVSATTGYNVYNASTLLQAFGDVTTATVTTGVNPSTTYALTVKAKNVNGTGPASNSISVTTTASPPPPPPPPVGNRIFTSTAYWNVPLPTNLSGHIRSDSDAAITAMGNTTGITGKNWITMSMSNFGMPIYYTKSSDPIYHVVLKNANVPDVFGPNGPGIKMPAGRAGNAEGAMTIIDRTSWTSNGQAGGGWVAAFHMAGATNWTGTTYQADGGAVFYIASNGLDASVANLWPNNTPPTTPAKNTGTLRGCPNNVRAGMTREDFLAGAINHCVEIFLNSTGNSFVYPWTHTESGNFNYAPEGTRIRIKPSVNIASVGPSGSAAWILAKCLQTYGGICGDQAGSGHNIKGECTQLRNGGGDDWAGSNLATDCLKTIPLIPANWEVVAPNYEP